MIEPLLTARELADLLGVCVETVLRWTRRGDLPGRRMPGGAIRYVPTEVEAWLDRRSTTGTSAAVVGGFALQPIEEG